MVNSALYTIQTQCRGLVAGGSELLDESQRSFHFKATISNCTQYLTFLSLFQSSFLYYQQMWVVRSVREQISERDPLRQILISSLTAAIQDHYEEC